MQNLLRALSLFSLLAFAACGNDAFSSGSTDDGGVGGTSGHGGTAGHAGTGGAAGGTAGAAGKAGGGGQGGQAGGASGAGGIDGGAGGAGGGGIGGGGIGGAGGAAGTWCSTQNVFFCDDFDNGTLDKWDEQNQTNGDVSLLASGTAPSAPSVLHAHASPVTGVWSTAFLRKNLGQPKTGATLGFAFDPESYPSTGTTVIASIESAIAGASCVTAFVIMAGAPWIMVDTVGVNPPYSNHQALTSMVDYTKWNNVLLTVTFGSNVNGTVEVWHNGVKLTVPGTTTVLTDSDAKIGATVGINQIGAPSTSIDYDNVTVDIN
jgi:hypothetical protein